MYYYYYYYYYYKGPLIRLLLRAPKISGPGLITTDGVLILHAMHIILFFFNFCETSMHIVYLSSLSHISSRAVRAYIDRYASISLA
jgi:hypothetical protein